MNRRNFLGTIGKVGAITPFVGSLITAPAIIEEKQQIDDLYVDSAGVPYLFTPKQIEQYGYKYVNNMVFTENGKNYTIKTRKTKATYISKQKLYMKGWLNAIPLETIQTIREKVLIEMDFYGITHIHSVSFNPCPVWVPLDWEATDTYFLYSVYVRGAIVRN